MQWYRVIVSSCNYWLLVPGSLFIVLTDPTWPISHTHGGVIVGSDSTIVVRQNKGPVSLDRTRHMTFKWNVCVLYIDSCNTPWEGARATNVMNHLESRYCQPDNPLYTIISSIKTTLLYSLDTAKYSFAVPRLCKSWSYFGYVYRK